MALAGPGFGNTQIPHIHIQNPVSSVSNLGFQTRIPKLLYFIYA